MLTKNELIVLYGMRTLDYEKDPDPDHWRTISGAKVHLDNNGEIDGGAGGKFTGNYWDGKKGQQHVVGPHTMMKKNIGSGATMFNMAAMGAFNNKVEPTNVEPKQAEPKPARKPKAPKEPAKTDFVFPKQTKFINAKVETPDQRWHQKTAERMERNYQNALQETGTVVYPGYEISVNNQIARFAKLVGISAEGLRSPETMEAVEADFGNAFATANNARKRPFGEKDIERYQKALEVLKNTDINELKIALAGINVKTVGMTPDKAYKQWLTAVDDITRKIDEKNGVVNTDIKGWRESVRSSDKKVLDKEFEKEKSAHEKSSVLEKYAKNYKPESVVGVPKGPDMDFEKADGNKANPNFRHIWDRDYKAGYTNNCQTCVVAFEMRIRGYDVEALPKGNNPFQDTLALSGNKWDCGASKAWVTEDGKHPIAQEYSMPTYNAGSKELYDWIDGTIKDGERYVFSVLWKGKDFGHIISAFRKDGKLVIYDPQSAKVMDDFEKAKPTLDKVAFDGGYFDKKPRLLRVDNCSPDMFYVNRVLKKAGA